MEATFQILLSLWTPLISSGVFPVAIYALGWKCSFLITCAGTVVTRTLYTLILQITEISLVAKPLAAEALNSLVTFLFQISDPNYKVKDSSQFHETFHKFWFLRDGDDPHGDESRQTHSVYCHKGIGHFYALLP